MNYLPPFAKIKELIEVSTVKGRAKITIDYDVFVNIVRELLSGVEVNEDWYLTENKDIAVAIKDGEFISAKHHFFEHGYFEGRLPYSITVDEKWYCAENSDVREGIRTGEVVSAQNHFTENGYREGRLPFDFSQIEPKPYKFRGKK